MSRQLKMQEEIFPLVDEKGNITGEAPRSICHNGSMLLHPVIHLHIFNSEGELLLQKRSKTKDIQPDRWDTSVGGHIDLGETPEMAVLREASEELNIESIKPIFITKYIIETERERELTYCYYSIYDGGYSADHNEVEDCRFWAIDDIEKKLGKEVFTFNFEQDFSLFIKKLPPCIKTSEIF